MALQKTLLRRTLGIRLDVQRRRLGAEAVVVSGRVVVGPVRALGLRGKAHLLVEAVLAPAGLLTAPGRSRRTVTSKPRLDAGSGRRRGNRRRHGEAGCLAWTAVYKLLRECKWNLGG